MENIMGRVYKNYTKELKEQACRMVLESKMPVRIVAERFNVGLQLLYRWIGQYETYVDEAFVGSGKLRSEYAEQGVLAVADTKTVRCASVIENNSGRLIVLLDQVFWQEGNGGNPQL